MGKALPPRYYDEYGIYICMYVCVCVCVWVCVCMYTKMQPKTMLRFNRRQRVCAVDKMKQQKTVWHFNSLYSPFTSQYIKGMRKEIDCIYDNKQFLLVCLHFLCPPVFAGCNWCLQWDVWWRCQYVRNLGMPMNIFLILAHTMLW